MLLTFLEAKKKIEDGLLLHISGTEKLLRQLPKGNWIGGSTEYFMSNEGGKISGEHLFVTQFYNTNFKVKSYDKTDIARVAEDTFDHGFSILIMPYESLVHATYAEHAASYKDMFLKNIVGWISGMNLEATNQTPIVVNGITGEVFSDKAVSLSLEFPEDKVVSVNIINIFDEDENLSVIKFENCGYQAKTCWIEGKEKLLADYIKETGFNIQNPIIGDYSGAKINTAIRSIEEDGQVHFAAPIFDNIDYRLSKHVADYPKTFTERFKDIDETKIVFSVNCLFNFLYGQMEGKKTGTFFGPVVFGEIAYQLVNQTLVYVKVD